MSLHTLKNPTSGKATLSFYNDDDTGIDSNAANSLALMTGGVDGLTIDSAQDVTIPNGNLTISAGNLSVTGNLSMSGVLTNSGNNRTEQVYKATIVSSVGSATTPGAVFAFSNPAGVAAIITKVYVNIGTAASSGTATIDIGTAAASNTSADNLIDGIALTGAGVFNNVASSGSNGTAIGRVLASNGWVTGTVASGNIGAAVGSVYVTYIPQ